MTLPGSPEVDIAALTRLFDDRTNSYKYLFLFAILDALEANYAESQSSIQLNKEALAIGMLVHAWYPHRYFRLSFGSQDQVSKILDASNLASDGQKFSFDRSGQERLRAWLRQACTPQQRRTLTRYVSQRMLRPFFAQELRGLKDALVDQRLVELARDRFEEVRPLYRLDPELGVVIHPAWVTYLRRHSAIVRGWASWHWAHYMQSRNPNVPAVSVKLFPPLERDSLATQRTYWKRALEQGEWKCIYSAETLATSSLALDHFLPWSFVAHDRLWNLIPVSPSANSSKGAALPDPAYLDDFCLVQARGLVAARPHYSPKAWTQVTEAFVADLHLTGNLLWGESLDGPALQSALKQQYHQTLPSLMALAQSTGFAAGWTYS